MNGCSRALPLGILILTMAGALYADQWQELSPATVPDARWGHTMNNVDGTVYLFGGTAGETSFNDLWIWDGATFVELTPAGPLPPKRYSHDAAAIDGKLYIFGGLTDQNGPYVDSDLWVYDPATDAWTQLAAGAGWAAGTVPERRLMHSAVEAGGRLLIYGGAGLENQALSDLWSYDPALGIWEEKASNPAAPRWGHSAVVLDDGKMYVFGGASSNFSIHNDLWIYDPAQDNWQTAKSQLRDGLMKKEFRPSARSMHAALKEIYDLGFFVLGGRGTISGVPIKQIIKYHSVDNTYTPGKDMPTGSIALAGAPVSVPNRNPKQSEVFLLFGGRGDDGAATNQAFYYHPETTTSDCSDGSPGLCLNAGRFRIEVDWRDFEDNTGSGQVVPYGSDDSALLWFFDADNWEMLIKVLDGCGVNNHFWVFSAATTNVEYTLRVTDTETGQFQEYTNPLGNRAAAVTDATAFATCGVKTAPAAVAEPVIGPNAPSFPQPLLSPAPSVGDELVPLASCAAGPTNLCLNSGRFRVEVDWRDFQGNTGSGEVVPYGSADSGLFWFFDPDNWEMLIKVLDGCALNNNFWVFSAATTNVEYTLRFTDTETLEVQEYYNPLGTSAPAITDTGAFATCP